MTGKSNFDISEWMLIRLLEALQGRRATIAMLCKTATARKVLRHAWLNGFDPAVFTSPDRRRRRVWRVSGRLSALHAYRNRRALETRGTVYGSLFLDHPLQTFGLSAGELSQT